MPKLSPLQAPRRPRTSAVAPPLPDLFGDAPGVGEMTARYANSSRPDASVDILRARVRAGGLDHLNDGETLELLLSRAMACGAKAHAAALLGRFGCRSVDGFCQRIQADLPFGELVDDLEQVPKISSQAIEAEYTDRVARPRELHQLGQLGAICLRTALGLGENSIAAGTLQCVQLGSMIL
jgi:hypothetical protein